LALIAASSAFGLGEEVGQDRHGIQARRDAQVEDEHAFAGQDVDRRAAVDLADGQGRALGRERRGRIGVALQRSDSSTSVVHQRDRDHVGRDAQVGQAGMGLAAGDRDAEAGDALVAAHGDHVGGLADHHQGRAGQLAGDDRDHVRRAQAADLLVVGEGQVDGLLEVALARSGAAARARARKPFMSQVPRP
jgi:hypothetical protein